MAQRGMPRGLVDTERALAFREIDAALAARRLANATVSVGARRPGVEMLLEPQLVSGTRRLGQLQALRTETAAAQRTARAAGDRGAAQAATNRLARIDLALHGGTRTRQDGSGTYVTGGIKKIVDDRMAVTVQYVNEFGLPTT